MAMKSIILVTFFVIILVATQAESQLVDVYEVIGNVSCSSNASVVFNGPFSTPRFPDALVKLYCGENLRGMAITNAMGVFNMIVSPSLVTLNTLLTSCNVALATPLSSCNSTLPSTGTILAPLEFVNTTTFLNYVTTTIIAPGKGILNDFTLGN